MVAALRCLNGRCSSPIFCLWREITQGLLEALLVRAVLFPTREVSNISLLSKFRGPRSGIMDDAIEDGGGEGDLIPSIVVVGL